MEIVTLTFNNGLFFRKCESRDVSDIILKAKMVPRDYNITAREKTRREILDACYATMREIHTRNLLIKVKSSGISSSGDGATVNNKPLINEIAHGTHNSVDFHNIFY